MTLPLGVFIAFGVIPYVILWRYIFLQFFKLVKPSDDSQDTLEEIESNFFDFIFDKFKSSSDKNNQETCRIVANNIIPPQQKPVSLSFINFSTQIQFERYVIKKNNIDLSLNQFICNIIQRKNVLEKFERFERILDVHVFINSCLQLRIIHCENRMLTKRDKTPRVMEVEDDDDPEDMRKPGNYKLKNTDESFVSLEAIDRHSISPEIIPKVKLAGKERDLNTMIRRLVAAELIKCCEKKYCAVNRAYSDTNNRVNWKRNKYSKQSVNSDAKPFLFGESYKTPKESCDSGSSEFFSNFLIPSKKYQDVQSSEKLNNNIIVKPCRNLIITHNITKSDQTLDSNNDDNDKRKIENPQIAEDETSIFCEEGHYRIKKSSELEYVVQSEEPVSQMIRTTKTDVILRPNSELRKFEDVSTQTEDMYMIRAIRSCPGRRRTRRDNQLVGTPCEMSKIKSNGKVIPIEISLPAFLYRKASDNLIYEMGKGSRSPSYVPVPQRFRWRYVTPTKSN